MNSPYLLYSDIVRCIYTNAPLFVLLWKTYLVEGGWGTRICIVIQKRMYNKNCYLFPLHNSPLYNGVGNVHAIFVCFRCNILSYRLQYLCGIVNIMFNYSCFQILFGIFSRLNFIMNCIVLIHGMVVYGGTSIGEVNCCGTM